MMVSCGPTHAISRVQLHAHRQAAPRATCTEKILTLKVLMLLLVCCCSLLLTFNAHTLAHFLACVNKSVSLFFLLSLIAPRPRAPYHPHTMTTASAAISAASAATSRSPRKPRANPDWPTIRHAYLSSNLSLREISRKFCVAPRSVFRRASKEKWADLKSGAANAFLDRPAEILQAAKLRAACEGEQLAKDTKVKIEAWIAQSLNTAGQLVTRVHEETPLAPTENLPALATVLEKADRVGRRSLGLDQTVAQQQVSVVNYGRLQLALRTAEAGSVTAALPPVDDVVDI